MQESAKNPYRHGLNNIACVLLQKNQKSQRERRHRPASNVGEEHAPNSSTYHGRLVKISFCSWRCQCCDNGKNESSSRSFNGRPICPGQTVSKKRKSHARRIVAALSPRRRWRQPQTNIACRELSLAMRTSKGRLGVQQINGDLREVPSTSGPERCLNAKVLRPCQSMCREAQLYRP